jgi:hypothetical protein
MQMIAVGDLSGIEEGKELVRNSFPCRTYLPENSEVWEEQYRVFLSVTGLERG